MIGLSLTNEWLLVVQYGPEIGDGGEVFGSVDVYDVVGFDAYGQPWVLEPGSNRLDLGRRNEGRIESRLVRVDEARRANLLAELDRAECALEVEKRQLRKASADVDAEH